MLSHGIKIWAERAESDPLRLPWLALILLAVQLRLGFNFSELRIFGHAKPIYFEFCPKNWVKTNSLFSSSPNFLKPCYNLNFSWNFAIFRQFSCLKTLGSGLGPSRNHREVTFIAKVPQWRPLFMLWNPFRKQRVEAQIGEKVPVRITWNQVQTMLEVTIAQERPKKPAEPENSAVQKPNPKVLVWRRDFENWKIRLQKWILTEFGPFEAKVGGIICANRGQNGL